MQAIVRRHNLTSSEDIGRQPDLEWGYLAPST